MKHNFSEMHVLLYILMETWLSYFFNEDKSENYGKRRFCRHIFWWENLQKYILINKNYVHVEPHIFSNTNRMLHTPFPL